MVSPDGSAAYFPHPPDFAAFQTDFNAVEVMGRFCQNVFHNTFREISRSLVFL